MNIKDRFFELLGIRPKRLAPIVKDEATTDPTDRLEAASRTQEALRQPAPTPEPVRPLTGITTDDLKDWRLRPDYLEAREKREADRRARAESAPAAIIDFDVRPPNSV